MIATNVDHEKARRNNFDNLNDATLKSELARVKKFIRVSITKKINKITEKIQNKLPKSVTMTSI